MLDGSPEGSPVLLEESTFAEVLVVVLADDRTVEPVWADKFVGTWNKA